VRGWVFIGKTYPCIISLPKENEINKRKLIWMATFDLIHGVCKYPTQKLR
jgi:hypothetical protein